MSYLLAASKASNKEIEKEYKICKDILGSYLGENDKIDRLWCGDDGICLTIGKNRFIDRCCDIVSHLTSNIVDRYVVYNNKIELVEPYHNKYVLMKKDSNMKITLNLFIKN